MTTKEIEQIFDISNMLPNRVLKDDAEILQFVKHCVGISNAFTDSFTIDKSVIEDIKAEIAESQNVVSEALKFDKEDCFYNGKWVGFELALAIIDKHIGRENECITITKTEM